jgi:hypothetical protein
MKICASRRFEQNFPPVFERNAQFFLVVFKTELDLPDVSGRRFLVFFPLFAGDDFTGGRL